MKHKIISWLCCLLMFSAVAFTAFAAEVPDLERQGSITLEMAYQGKPVAGGTLVLYRVAEVHLEREADYSFRLTDEYAGSGVSLENLGDPAVALALAEYAEAQELPGTTGKIGKDGTVVFSQLELGLYLLVQKKAASGYAPVNPFLVSVPGKEGGSYVYDVDASPKTALEPVPTEPPTDPTEPTLPPKLPQTGMNQRPVPMLAVGGILLFLLGLVLYTAGKRKANES